MIFPLEKGIFLNGYVDLCDPQSDDTLKCSCVISPQEVMVERRRDASQVGKDGRN